MHALSYTPLVSIIIPVYNGGNYLREAIDSALAQTYSNCEVIIVNDGSNDEGKTEEIALSYKDRVHYFKQENGGVATALNKGIAEMRGEYFSWLSHDDVYHNEKVYTQISQLQNQDKMTICYSSYELIDDKSAHIGEVIPSSLYPRGKLSVPLFPLLRGLFAGCTLLIHKNHFLETGLFDPERITTQDYALWFKILQKDSAKVSYSELPLVKTRIHETQTGKTCGDHQDECNILWQEMITSVSTEQMKKLDGSPYAFFKNMKDFLSKHTNYDKATETAKQLLRAEEDALDTYVANCMVSVIIPFYNRIELLCEAIESVYAQTHKNFEIILVNDGSTDDLSPLDDFLKRPEVTYYWQENKGPGSARNFGVKKSKGEYIAFLDSDDLFKPNKLKQQLYFMVQNGFNITHTSYDRISLASGENQTINSAVVSGNIFKQIIADCRIATPTVMFSRSISEDVWFKEDIRTGEDVCAWIDAAYKHFWGALPEPLTEVRVSLGSASISYEKSVLGLLNIMQHNLTTYGWQQARPSCAHLSKSIYTLSEHEIAPEEKKYPVENNSSLLVKCYKFYRKHGFIATCRKIKFVVLGG